MLLMLCAVLLVACRDDSAPPPARAGVVKSEHRQLLDQSREDDADVPDDDLDRLRRLAVEYYDLTGDYSAVAAWAGRAQLVDLHRLDARQRAVLDEFSRLGGHEPAEYDSVDAMRGGIGYIDALDEGFDQLIRHHEGRPDDMRRRLEGAGLPEAQVAAYADEIAESIVPIVDSMRATRQVGTLSRERFVLLVENQGRWHFDPVSGAIGGEPAVVTRYNELSDAHAAALTELLARFGTIGDSDG
jgi:hypothetical protein